jgi:hypothetical protein
MRKRSVVFELSDREIRAFWLSVHPFRKQVLSSHAVKFERISIPIGVIEQGNVQNEKVLTDLLSSYRTQNSGVNPKAYLAISLQQGFIRSYTLPWIAKRDRKSAISLLVDEESAIERSDLLYDFLVLTEEKYKNLQILLGATRKSILERYVFILGQAGFKVSGVDFAFSILGFETHEDVLYLRGESHSLQIALFCGAVPVSVRSLSERAEEWESEIRRFLLYYKTQHSALNLKRLVWSGDCRAESLAQGLQKTNSIRVVEQAGLRNIPNSWQKHLEGKMACGEAVVGYGLRLSVHGQGLNLWREPDTTQTVQRRCQGIALFTGALFFLGTIIWFLLYQMALPLEQEVAQFSCQGTRIEEQVKLQKELEAAWNKSKIHADGIGDGLVQIQAIQTLIGTELKIEQVIYKQGSMSLRGNAKDAGNVQTLIDTLRTMGWEQPALTSYKFSSQNNVEFSLSTKGRKVGTKIMDVLENTYNNM